MEEYRFDGERVSLTISKPENGLGGKQFKVVFERPVRVTEHFYLAPVLNSGRLGFHPDGDFSKAIGRKEVFEMQLNDEAMTFLRSFA